MANASYTTPGDMLDGLDDWLRERFRRHRGNADVVRQDWRPRRVSLPVCGRCSGRSSFIGRRCWRRLGRRFGSRRPAAVLGRLPLGEGSCDRRSQRGRQLRIDVGRHPERQAARGSRSERLVEIGGRKVKVFLFVATLGYSRRLHVLAFRHERQESWFDGMATPREQACMVTPRRVSVM